MQYNHVLVLLFGVFCGFFCLEPELTLILKFGNLFNVDILGHSSNWSKNTNILFPCIEQFGGNILSALHQINTKLHQTSSIVDLIPRQISPQNYLTQKKKFFFQFFDQLAPCALKLKI